MKDSKKKEHMHSVRYNFIMNFILTASRFVFPLITFPYVSRVLLAEGNGKVAFASSVANYFMMVASLGIPTYGVRACSQVREDKKALSKTVQEIYFINLIMTVLVSITYLSCVFTIPKFQAERSLFLINGVDILLNMFGMNWVFQALEKYDYITVRSLIFKCISIGLMFALVHKQEDYVVYAAITVFAAVGSNLFNFIQIQKYIDFSWVGKYNLKRHIKPVFILFAQSLAVSVYTNLDTVMLGFMKTGVDVGYYNAAVKIKSILLSIVTSLGNVLLPRMSYYAKHNLKLEFKDMMLKALNFTVLMSIPLVMYFVLFARESIIFIAGDGYVGAISAMQIITIAIIPNGLTSVLGIQVLTALEKEKNVLCSVVVGASTDFVLNMVFIPSYGAAGAAFATTVAEFMVLFVQIFFTKGLLREMNKSFRFPIYFILSALCGGISYAIKWAGIQSVLWKLLLSAIVFWGIYVVGLFVTKEPVVLEMINDFSVKLETIENGRRKR